MKYSSRQYAEALYDLLKESPHNHKKVIQGFARLLEANGHLKMTEEIMEEFVKVSDAKEGIVRAEVTTVKESPHFPHELGKETLKTSITHDPHIKAGIRIKVADTVIENTLANRLKNLKKVIAQ